MENIYCEYDNLITGITSKTKFRNDEIKKSFINSKLIGTPINKKQWDKDINFNYLEFDNGYCLVNYNNGYFGIFNNKTKISLDLYAIKRLDGHICYFANEENAKNFLRYHLKNEEINNKFKYNSSVFYYKDSKVCKYHLLKTPFQMRDIEIEDLKNCFNRNLSLIDNINLIQNK